MINKRGDIPIPILLFFFLTVVLVVVTLGFFVVHELTRYDTLSVSSSADTLSIERLRLHFYLQEIFDSATEGFTASHQKNVFIAEYLDALDQYYVEQRWVHPALAQISEQIISEHIILDSEKIILTLDIVLDQQGEDLSLSYSYEERFEKVFKA